MSGKIRKTWQEYLLRSREELRGIERKQCNTEWKKECTTPGRSGALVAEDEIVLRGTRGASDSGGIMP